METSKQNINFLYLEVPLSNGKLYSDLYIPSTENNISTTRKLNLSTLQHGSLLKQIPLAMILSGLVTICLIGITQLKVQQLCHGIKLQGKETTKKSI